MKRTQRSRTQRESHLGMEPLDARQVMSATAVNFEIQEVPVAISSQMSELGGREIRANLLHVAKSPTSEPGVRVEKGSFQDALRVNLDVTEFIKALNYSRYEADVRSEGVRALELLLLGQDFEASGNVAFFTQSLNSDALFDQVSPEFSPIILWRHVFSDGGAGMGNVTLEASAAPLEIELLESPRETSARLPGIQLQGDNQKELPPQSAASLGRSTAVPVFSRHESAASPLQRFEDAIDRLLIRSSRRNDWRPSDDAEGGLLSIDPMEKFESDGGEAKSPDKKVSLNLNELEQIWSDLVQSMLPQTSRRATPLLPSAPTAEPQHQIAAIENVEGGMVELSAAGPLPTDLPHRPESARLASRPKQLETGIAFFTEFDLSTTPANVTDTPEDRQTRPPRSVRKTTAEAAPVETDFHSAALLAPLFFVGMAYGTGSEDGTVSRPYMRRQTEQLR